MRVVNSSRDPIYVDGTQGRLGLTVERELNGKVYPFDDLACQCQQCANICNSNCSCPEEAATIRRIGAGDVAERQWDGVVQVAGTRGCSPQPCLNQENGPLNEPFVLRFCYSAQEPSGVIAFDDAGVASGRVEALAQDCVDKSFIIQDGVVEIGPERGASCNSTSDCPRKDELCFSGACTTGCPANHYPSPGSSTVGLAKDDMGFFAESSREGGKSYVGTGSVSSTVYVGTSLKIYLTRHQDAGTLTAQLTLSLPPSTGVPIETGTLVSVTMLDNGQPGASTNRAVVIREATSNKVLLAADMGQGGSMLLESDLAPLSVTSGTVPIGCRVSACGRHLYYLRRMALSGGAVEVEPGERASLVTGADTWTILSVSNGAFASTSCAVSEMRPWVLWHEPE